MNYAYQEGFNEGYRKGYEDGMMALQARMVLNMIDNTDDSLALIKTDPVVRRDVLKEAMESEATRRR